ncbi:hypothetical protein [Fervidobacterium thailandense]|uniref:Uncharacterized protein n=1 Tax=Fervidobacterium thailandense TaxID=1008305 RepID=A0A1E3G202_9BACT|nr:hypothetical protein [Fervidobacterium thailandense]ODN29853.1 hypothetical protein A4H02_08585 [Fervidobacterium thailandense]
MRSVTVKQSFMMFLGFLTAIAYIKDGEYLFGLVLAVFSSVFLLGIFEQKNLSFSYKIAHLYVGSILMVIAASYLILTFGLSYFNLLVGENPLRLSIPDLLLVVTGIVALFNVISLKKAVTGEKTP